MSYRFSITTSDVCKSERMEMQAINWLWGDKIFSINTKTSLCLTLLICFVRRFHVLPATTYSELQSLVTFKLLLTSKCHSDICMQVILVWLHAAKLICIGRCDTISSQAEKAYNGDITRHVQWSVRWWRTETMNFLILFLKELICSRTTPLQSWARLHKHLLI